MKKRKPKEVVAPATRALLAELVGHYQSAQIRGYSPRSYAVPLEHLPDTGVPEEAVDALVDRASWSACRPRAGAPGGWL